MSNSPRESFLQYIASRNYGLALNSQWILIIHELPRIKGIIDKVVDVEDWTSGDWAVDEETYAALTNEQVQTTNGMGCFFVDNVVIPGDGYSQEEATITSGGFVSSGVAGRRNTFSGKRVGTSFRETNLDFVEGVLRPWTIACSYLGFFAYQDESLYPKITRMQLINFSKGSSPNSPSSTRPIRKIYNFFNVAPIEIDSKTYSYNEDQGTPQTRSVGWMFDAYTVKVGFSG